jgi:hypothetical protein
MSAEAAEFNIFRLGLRHNKWLVAVPCEFGSEINDRLLGEIRRRRESFNQPSAFDHVEHIGQVIVPSTEAARESGSPSGSAACFRCRHWTKDKEAEIRLDLNYSVGRCAKDRAVSHGLTRGHDQCELFQQNISVMARPDGGPNT